MATQPATYNNNFQFVDMKQQNRFILRGAGDITPYLIRASNLPNVDNNPVTVDTINADYKIKGKSRWQDISITFYDPISTVAQSGADSVHKWLLQHHTSDTNIDGYMQQYKYDLQLHYIAPDGSETGEYWELHGAFFASIDFGAMDLTGDDLVTIEGQISYDWARLMGGGAGGVTQGSGVTGNVNINAGFGPGGFSGGISGGISGPGFSVGGALATR
jgi:hypothetical protein